MSAGTDPDSTRAARPRRRGLLPVLLATAVLVLAIAYWLTRPQQVADLVLDQVGRALDLEISTSGVSEYRLAGVPRLVVRDLVARQPGAEVPLLRAGRVALSLPWSTIRARGAELVVERLEVEALVVDLGALQRWLATRPPGPGPRIPTITDGVRIEDGRLLGEGWSFEAIMLDLPALHPGRAVRARVRGGFHNGDIRVPFDLHVALTRPAAGAGLGVFGDVSVSAPGWRMPMRVLASGRLDDGIDGIGIDDFQLGSLARLDRGAEPLRFVFGVAGPLRWRDGRLGIEPAGLVLHGGEMVPTLEARGAFAWQQQLDLHLQGRMAGWPQGWPVLPASLGKPDVPLPFRLDYAGAPDLSGRTMLQLRREATRFDARFHLPQVLAWLEQLDAGTPLPPLDGRLTTPGLEIAGATLEGIELEFESSGAADE